ncbi:hypothetical protein [Vibrio phage JSF12]|uniref:Uncharacterized protein n=2 Tax=Jesfedecavirus TaxID=2560156 RepID=A0A2D0YLT5_9CAUD|nr:hypothetical protein FDI98_gp096 [Vibrio phage JSF10]YP_009794828.1 hypothetical protein HOS35_gp145 [Vibrio phage JSF12]ASV43436.1 hypothetical protein [Vibrio phage JSF10]ASV43663.1 hypothetical protein [Vibrio phage JSF12]
MEEVVKFEELVKMVRFKAIAGSVSDLPEESQKQFELAVPQPIHINYNTSIYSSGEVTLAKVLENGSVYVEGVVDEPLIGTYVGFSMRLHDGGLAEPGSYGAFLRHKDACATVMEAI